MNRRKVAHVVNSIGLGGVPMVVQRLLSVLPPEGYESHLYVLKAHAAHSRQDVVEMQTERFRQMGVRVSFPDHYEKKFQVVGELCRWIIRDGIDALHTHSYKPNIYGRLAGALCRDGRLRIIGHYHNQYDDKWERDGSLVLDRLLERVSDRLIACSESVRSHISERVGIPAERIRVILNGVELERFSVRRDPEGARAELGIPRDRRVVGIVGRICEQKGQDDFIKAAKIVSQAVPGTVFLVVGEADDAAAMDRVRRLAADLGVEQDVFFPGYVPDVPKVYSVLDVLVVPSRWEGFGLVLVEAMAAGTPIVATRVGAIPEVVGPDGPAVLVPPASPESIAVEVVRLLRDPDRAREMSRKGIERSAAFSWERAGRELHDLYEELFRGDRS